MSELEIKGSVESLHLEPGDKVIVTIDALNHESMRGYIDTFRGSLKEIFPDNEIIFVSSQIQISKVTA